MKINLPKDYARRLRSNETPATPRLPRELLSEGWKQVADKGALWPVNAVIAVHALWQRMPREVRKTVFRIDAIDPNRLQAFATKIEKGDASAYPLLGDPVPYFGIMLVNGAYIYFPYADIEDDAVMAHLSLLS